MCVCGGGGAGGGARHIIPSVNCFGRCCTYAQNILFRLICIM